MDVIHHVLDKHAGDKPKAALELGIALKTLYNKLNQYQAELGQRAKKLRGRLRMRAGES